MYILTKNNIIQGVFSSIEKPKNATVVPNEFNGVAGENLNLFNADWSRKPLQQLVDENILIVETGKKIENNKIVDMSEVERIQNGIDEMPLGKKIEDDLLIDMTIEEKLDAGLLNENDAEYVEFKINEYQSYLNTTDWYAIRYADTGEPIPNNIKNERAEAREQISLLRGQLEQTATQEGE